MKPMLIAVDDHVMDLEAIRRELFKRYGEDYGIECDPSPTTSLTRLHELRSAGAEVVALLAGQSMTEMSGLDFLERGHELFPHAARVLLLPSANRSELKPVLEAVSLGKLDYYTSKPQMTPDERFHEVVAAVLNRWQRRSGVARIVTVVGDRVDPGSYRIRDLLERSGLPFAFYERDSAEGREVGRSSRRGRSARRPRSSGRRPGCDVSELRSRSSYQTSASWSAARSCSRWVPTTAGSGSRVSLAEKARVCITAREFRRRQQWRGSALRS